jgi:sortase A
VKKWDEKYGISIEGQGKDFNIELNEEYIEDLKAEKVFPFKMRIPEINFVWIVSSGVDDEILKIGPGHINGTSLPGQYGRCSVAAHRTTYGAPFSNIDKIQKGDIIEIESPEGLVFFYEVKDRAIFKKTDVHLLDNYGKRELVLIACTPKYTLIRRLGIFAELTKIVDKNI